MSRLIQPVRSSAVTRDPVPQRDRSTECALRVIMVLYRDDLNAGGSLRVVEVLANSLDPSRVEVHILFAYGGPGPIAKRTNVSCHFIESNGPLDLLSWRKARSVIDSIHPDVIHFHNPAYWLHAALLGKKYKKLIHLH